jgi:endonuclease/exonuclease/phosphatase family metal-dependent hydrolase
VQQFAPHRMTWPGRHRSSGGTTIFVSDRVRVLDCHHSRLPVRWPDRTRGYAVVRVAAPGGTELTAVSVHLSLKPDERVVHTERILQALSDRGSLIIAGDLNEGDTGAAWRLIDVPDRMRLVSPAAPTFPAKRPRRCSTWCLRHRTCASKLHRDAAWMPVGAGERPPGHLGRPRGLSLRERCPLWDPYLPGALRCARRRLRSGVAVCGLAQHEQGEAEQ